MSIRGRDISRYKNRYFTPPEIQDHFQQAQDDGIDFYSGLYSPTPCPSKYNKKTVRQVALSAPFVLDFDGHTPHQRHTVNQRVKDCINTLHSLGANLTLFHSGRGYHVVIPGARMRPRLYCAHKWLASKIAHGADPIHDPYRVIRHAGSFNSKSKTYKTAISVDDLDITPKELAQRLVSPPKELPDVEPSKEFDSYLIESYEEHLESIKHCKPIHARSGKLIGVPNESHLSYRAFHILQSCSIPQGTRHFATFSLAIELRDIEVVQQETFDILKSWGRKLPTTGSSQSCEEEILIDTERIVAHVYDEENQETTRYRGKDLLKKVRKRYPRHYHNRKHSEKWKKHPNECRVYCVFLAMKDFRSQFFLANSVIRDISRLKHLTNRKTNYIHSLIDKGYIELIPPDNISFYVFRSDNRLNNTYCYRVLK